MLIYDIKPNKTFVKKLKLIGETSLDLYADNSFYQAIGSPIINLKPRELGDEASEYERQGRWYEYLEKLNKK